MTESRIAAVLRAYGVRRRDDPPSPDTMSIRDAEKKTGVSRETIARLMRPLESNERRRIRADNLRKLAEGLGIPLDLLERENLADWGYVQAVEESDLATLQAQLRELSPEDLVKLQIEISHMQQGHLRALRRPEAGVPDAPDEDDD